MEIMCDFKEFMMKNTLERGLLGARLRQSNAKRSLALSIILGGLTIVTGYITYLAMRFGAISFLTKLVPAALTATSVSGCISCAIATAKEDVPDEVYKAIEAGPEAIKAELERYRQRNRKRDRGTIELLTNVINDYEETQKHLDAVAEVIRGTAGQSNRIGELEKLIRQEMTKSNALAEQLTQINQYAAALENIAQMKAPEELANLQKVVPPQLRGSQGPQR